MLNKLLSYVSSIKLTLGEAVAGLIATVIGGLVMALKIQGSRLHRAQVQLLSQKLDSKQARAAADTEDARAKYQDAVTDFLKAGGTLVLAIMLGLSSPARIYGKSQQKPIVIEEPTDLLPQCESALFDCDNLVKTQDRQIQVLQDSVKQWHKAAESNEPSLLELIPWEVWAGVGAVIGFGVGRTIK